MAPRDTAAGSCLPTTEQALLLHAALDEGDAARSAWQAWRGRVDLDRVDAASFRLLPLLHRNLVRLGVDDPWHGRLAGVVRRSWTRNRVIVHHATEAVRGLVAAGIPVLVLKGAALAILHYRDLSLRPMNDVDVLVPAADAARARARLAAAGWTPTMRLPESYLPYVHALGYRSAGGGELDLHWHVLWECCRDGDDDAFWGSAVPLEGFGLTGLALAPAEQLLHVCVHGLRWSETPAVHWVADAVTVVRACASSLDWDRVTAIALDRGLSLPLGAALGYLAGEFAVPVPARVLSCLASARPGLRERIEFRARTRSPRLARGALLHWSDHARLASGQSLVRRVVGFPRYMACVWGVERIGRLPAEAARRIAARLGRGRTRGRPE